MMISVCDRVENIAGKGENAGYQHFLLFPQCFQKHPVSRSLKLPIVWYRVPERKSLEKTEGKLGNGANQHFLYFLTIVESQLYRPLHNAFNVGKEKNKFLFPSQNKFQFFSHYVHSLGVSKLFTTQSRLLMTLGKKPFENIAGKGENAGNQHFLHFPHSFLPFQKQISIFW